MKRPFGARPAGCFTLSKHWIVANRRSEHVVPDEIRCFKEKSAKMARKTEQPGPMSSTAASASACPVGLAVFVSRITRTGARRTRGCKSGESTRPRESGPTQGLFARPQQQRQSKAKPQTPSNVYCADPVEAGAGVCHCCGVAGSAKVRCQVADTQRNGAVTLQERLFFSAATV
jgi:hypothetical protein